VRIRPAIAGIAAVLLLLTACGPAQDSGASPVQVGVAATASPAATPVPPATPSPAGAGATGAPATLPPTTDPVEEDEGLLAVLPEEVDGAPVARVPLAFEEASDLSDFTTSIGSAVFFVAAGAADLVSGLVAKPRDGVYSEDWYGDWRETYDDGACAQAGGIGGRAEAAIGGRPVSITTCAGGMRVYHAWVEEQGVVVSLLAIGDNRLGEKVMASLRP
jgi:hypothetical protein